MTTLVIIIGAALFLVIAGLWGDALARRAYRDVPPPSRRRRP